MNQIIMQKLAMFIFRTTRTQYENLNDEILKRKLVTIQNHPYSKMKLG